MVFTGPIIRYFNKFLKMNKTRTFMHSLKEQIECIKNMLLPRKKDYYFKSYNVSNIASRVSNNVRNVNGPRYKNCDRLTSPCSYCKSVQDNDAIIA